MKMRSLKWLAAVLVCALAVCAVYRFSWLPYRCEIIKKQRQQIVFSLINLPSSFAVVRSARAGIANMQRCIQTCPTDPDMYMTLAAYQRVLGQLQEASDAYTAALAYDRRPEIFLNLGLVQLQMNQSDLAMGNLTKACLFNLNYVNDIPNLNIRQSVLRAVHEEHNRGIPRRSAGPGKDSQ